MSGASRVSLELLRALCADAAPRSVVSAVVRYGQTLTRTVAEKSITGNLLPVIGSN
jgi:hypothetical protein